MISAVGFGFITQWMMDGVAAVYPELTPLRLFGASLVGLVLTALLAAANMDGLAGAVEYFKGAIDSLLISTAMPYLDTLAGMIRGAADLATRFQDLPPSVQRFAAVLTAVLAVGGHEFPQCPQFFDAQCPQFVNRVVCQVFAHDSPRCILAWLPASAAWDFITLSRPLLDGAAPGGVAGVLTWTCTLGVTVTLGTAAVPRAVMAFGSITAARCRALTARSAPSHPVLNVPRACSTRSKTSALPG